ncbi:MAG: hypothetical protein IJH75_01695 [Mogibacterium sp.]|nr:hypothetical protein [Mogibacterium sp.]
MFREHELLYNAQAYYTIEAKWGKDFLAKATEDLGVLCEILAILSEQAEAFHRYMGLPTKQPLLAAELMITLKPSEISRAREEVLRAFVAGMELEHDPDEEVDEVLQELNQKKREV